MSGRFALCVASSNNGKSSKRICRRPKGKSSISSTSGAAAAYAPSSASRRRRFQASSTGLPFSSSSCLNSASLDAGGSCSTRYPSTGRPPLASVTWKPAFSKACASVAARRKWPMPRRCWT